MPALSWIAGPQTDASTREFKLRGDITERSDLPGFFALLGSMNRVDVGAIEKINSTGVRVWLMFIDEVDRSGKTLILERCSVSFVAQLNMISNFCGNARIQSIMGPYNCTACGASSQRIIELTKDIAAQIDAPLPCPECSADMEFDDMPDHYFAFAKKPKKAG